MHGLVGWDCCWVRWRHLSVAAALVLPQRKIFKNRSLCTLRVLLEAFRLWWEWVASVLGVRRRSLVTFRGVCVGHSFALWRDWVFAGAHRKAQVRPPPLPAERVGTSGIQD